MARFGNLIRIGTEITVQEIYEWALAFTQEPSPKRFEENIKFVFKITFKKLKSNLLKKNHISFYSKKFDHKFYDYYFGQTAVDLNVSIEEFYDPLNNKGALKTLNNEYLKLVFKSEIFRNDFVQYLSNDGLVKDYHYNIRRKVRQLLAKFDLTRKSDDIDSVKKCVINIQQYFRMNRQCKLPWSNTEIVTAIQSFLYALNSL